MKRLLKFTILCFVFIVIILPQSGNAASDILNAQENLWLTSRNNTIIVYPEKNFPPYSYQNTSGAPQGLSIDYIELIAKKVGAKIEYLPARPISQILDDVRQSKKGDVITSLTDAKEREDILYFTDNYVTSPAVIVVRKDLDNGHTLTLSDLSGKKVAIGSQYAVEGFIRTNNPRIVIESVVDDESGLQQLVLGEVDAAVMDITSLSYYLSKQVLNSVKVVGNTGFEYKLSFAVPKNEEILQSILDKGLQQISTNDRKILTEKWVVVPNEIPVKGSIATYISENSNIIVIAVLIACIMILLIRRRRKSYILSRNKKLNAVEELKEEMAELEDTSKSLQNELSSVHTLEEEIKEKLHKIEG